MCIRLFPALLLFGTITVSAQPFQAPPVQEGTQVVVLGTGTPVIDSNRAGAGIAVVVNGQAYLFDVGGGVVRRLHEGSQTLQIRALRPAAVGYLFLTHLHSDHTDDYPELVSTSWWDRREPLQAFGPTGLSTITNAMIEMQSVDHTIRLESLQPVANPNLPKVVATEIEAGVVFENEDIRIEAFEVNHEKIEPAYGYRIDTEDRSIVISGDTAFSETLLEKSRGVDLLFHEIASRKGLDALPPNWQDYHSKAHITADEMGRLASLAQPKHLVLYHLLFFGVDEQTLHDEVAEGFDGKITVASDLDTF